MRIHFRNWNTQSSPGRTAVDNNNCKAICRSLPPTTQIEVRLVLGVCSVYPCFFSSIARAAASLKVRPENIHLFEFELTVVELQAFHELEKRLMYPFVLDLPRRRQRYTLDTDPCDYQKEGALCSSHRTKIRFTSDNRGEAYLHPKKKYSTTEK